jgi:hypothetical protein
MQSAYPSVDDWMLVNLQKFLEVVENNDEIKKTKK